MPKTFDLKLKPELAFDELAFEAFAKKKAGLSENDVATVRQIRRSIDARGSKVWVNVKAEIYINETVPELISYQRDYKNVSNEKQVIIVGAGPAGMFAALRLIELGLKPILLERGKDVRARRLDLAAINKQHIVNSESNYCFGEGGAGTYSDGKLYTRSKKRGSIIKILETLVAHGATSQILVDAHPHIGTNKLPKVVAELRESIINAGGEVHFDTKVTDLILEKNEIKGVETAQGNRIEGEGVILATGHSARDIFELLDQKKVLIEAKPFALGVRVEHQQSLIDTIQYCLPDRGKLLPAAPYSLVSQAFLGKGKQKGVFSFCMCPGGFIVPSATASGEVVVNGMSPSSRNSKYANSGIVTEVNEKDWQKYIPQYGALAGMMYQKEIEQKACQVAGNTQLAPAQLLRDFVKNRPSEELLPTSYIPGLTSVKMDDVLPRDIAVALRKGFSFFGKKMNGYLTNDAQIVGVESRTSSPVRIPRDKLTLEHTQIERLYPCGEGAGYAGGIVSAAMDGQKCVDAFAKKYENKEV